MIVQHRHPKNKILQKYLEFYYFLRTDDPTFDSKYYAFPNVLTPLSIHRNIEATIAPYSTIVSGSDSRNNLAIVQGMRTKPLFANLRGKLDKVTIVFKPLGLNHFVRRPFSAICPNDSQLFIEWNEAESYPTFLDDFYATDDQAKRCDLLEDFLLSLHRPIENGVKLQNAISLLIDFEKALSIEEIACAIGLTTRTFNRLFRDNLGISPIGFRKIARFRHSLNFKLFDEQFKRLTDVAYNSNFYDQSYFISIYKKMTGSNPKMFFEEVERVGADKLLFQFLKS